MKWAKTGAWVARSNTMPAYTVAKFMDEGEAKYRASFRGEFIGGTVDSAKKAQQLCENHHLITQEAKEIDGKEKLP